MFHYISYCFSLVMKHIFQSKKHILLRHLKTKSLLSLVIIVKNEFLINSLTEVNEISNCSYEIIYENYKAKIFINSVESDLKDINIQEFFNEKLFENSKFADRVVESIYDSNDKNISSKVYTFIGDTPSNIQFYITNNKNKFFTGSLYFNSKPNYDSLIPYIDYIGDDIKKMVDSFTWTNE